MKKNITIVLFFPLLLFTLEAASQNADLPPGKLTILMKDGSRIRDVLFWQLHSSILEYEKNNNLHDAIIADIENIESANDTWFFDSTGALKIVPCDLLITVNDDSIYCKIKMVNFVYLYIDYQRKEIPPTTAVSRLTFDKIKKYSLRGEEHIIEPDSCKNSESPGQQPQRYSDNGYYQMGEEDAGKYYNGTGAAIGGFYSGFTPFLGWCIGLPILLGTDPKMSNHHNANAGLLNNKDYFEGYHKKAKGNKTTNVLVGFGIGLVSFLAIVL